MKIYKQFLKSQVSMFIILGIFILIIFLLFLFFQNSNVVSDSEQGIYDHIPTSSSFENQLEKCVQEKVELGFDMLFKQGGIIYEDQGGIFERPDFISKCVENNTFPKRICTYDGYAINYGIINEINSIYNIPRNFKGSGSYQGLDTYSAGAATGIFNQADKVPYFGQVNLPKLCNKDGPNNPNADSKFSCLPQMYNQGDFDQNFTVQSQIDNYLSKAVISCMDDPLLVKEFDYRYEGNSSVITTFTEDSTLVKLNFSIIYEKGNSDVRISPQYSFPLRVKKLYTLGYLISEMETKDIFFDKTIDYQDLEVCTNDCWDSKMVVDVKRNFLGTSDPQFAYDDLLVIQDRSSEINEFFSPKNKESYILQFVIPIQNRRPFIDVIQNQPVDSSVYGFDYGENYGLGPSTPVSSRTVKFKFNILDPDEDTNLIYGRSLGFLSIIEKERPRFSFYSSPGVVDSSQYNVPSPTISVPTGAGPYEISFVLGCTSQCKQGDFQGKPYHPTTYTYVATVSDGQFEDNQVFSISINP